MTPDSKAYSQVVLSMYLQLPDTPQQARAFDRRVVRELYSRQVPLPTIEAALLLAAARRLYRSPDQLPLPPIRSLAYFLPIVEEIRQQPLPPHYIDYLRSKVPLKSAR
jgi:hypothetical protein